MDWQHDGLGVPLEVKEATKEYRDEMDIVGRFLDEQCELCAGGADLG